MLSPNLLSAGGAAAALNVALQAAAAKNPLLVQLQHDNPKLYAALTGAALGALVTTLVSEESSVPGQHAPSLQALV